MRRNRNQTNDLKRVKEIIDLATTASEQLRNTLTKSDEALRGRLTEFGDGLVRSAEKATRFTESLSESSDSLRAQLAATKAVLRGIELVYDRSAIGNTTNQDGNRVLDLAQISAVSVGDGGYGESKH